MIVFMQELSTKTNTDCIQNSIIEISTCPAKIGDFCFSCCKFNDS
jgi:hypothetical protein